MSRDVAAGGGDPVVAYGLRGWRWALAGLVTGLAAGTAVVLATPPQYAATAAVEVSRVAPIVDPDAPGGDGRPLTIDTDAHIMTSDEVVSAAAQAAGRSPEQVRRAVRISARPLSRVLEITFMDQSPQVAKAGADSAAAAFLRARERLVVQPVHTYLQSLANGVDAANAPDAAAAATAADVARLTTREQHAAALAAELPGPGALLENARITSAADRGNIEVPLASGASLGALLGFTTGLLRNRRRLVHRTATRPHPRPTPAEAMTAAGHSRTRARGVGRAWRGRRWRMLVATLVLALAGVGLGAGLAARIAVPAVAQTTVLLYPLPGTAFASRSADNTVDLRTEAQLALSDAVLQRVAARRPGGDVAALRASLRVAVLPRSEVIVVSARAGSGAQAAEIAQQVAKATLEIRHERAAAAYRRRAATLETQIKAAEAGLAAATKRAVPAGGESEEVKLLSQRLVSLRDEQRAGAAEPADPGALAATSIGVDRDARLLRLAVVAAAGLVAALVGLWLGGRRWRRGARRLQPRPRMWRLQLRSARAS